MVFRKRTGHVLARAGLGSGGCSDCLRFARGISRGEDGLLEIQGDPFGAGEAGGAPPGRHGGDALLGSGELGRRTLLRRGLLAGFGLATLAIGSAALTGEAAASTVSPDINEPLWLWCYKCQGLFYGSYILSSKCPDGGTHAVNKSLDYELAYNVPGGAGLQSDWLWCNKCQGLFYGPHAAVSACPAGGAHNGTKSGNYVLGLNSDKAVPATGAYQRYWLWCSKCQGLFFGYGSHEAASKCPRGGAHNGDESGDYNVAVVTTGSSVAASVPRTSRTGTAVGWPHGVVFR
jgi:hypothetical protein